MKKSIETLLKLGVGLHLTAEQAEATINDIMALKAERDALAAHLAAIQQAWACAGRWPDSPTQLTNLAMAIEATPQQHLREIRAEAGRAGFVAGVYERDRNIFMANINRKADEYADSIRKGEVE